MPGPLYTARLALVHAESSPVSIVVPGDELWVIRTITQFVAGGGTLGGMQLIDQATDATIWWTQPPISATGEFEAWYDMRIVLPTGSTTSLVTAGGTDVGLYGFKLPVS